MKEIKKKGFEMRPSNDTKDVYETYNPVDFAKIKVGAKTLDDAIVDLGVYKKINPRLGDKKEVLRAIASGDLDTMREISNFFFKTSGIYSRLCRYMAYLYRYDWLVTPYINSTSANNDKILETFHKVLLLLFI